MNIDKINFNQKFSKFNDYWSPRIIAELNDYQFKVVKIKDEFVWHSHRNTDEAFIVLDGEMWIKFIDKEIHLSKGEMFVVPKGVEHKPHAIQECQVLIVEPKGVINTGDNNGELTKTNEEWI